MVTIRLVELQCRVSLLENVHSSSGSQDTFSHREFSFTLKDDVYVRYQSFDSQQALEEGIKKTMPYKIDIGAIFSVKVCGL